MLTKILPIPKHPEEQLEGILADGISSLDLSQRTVNSLERQGVRTVGELMHCCDHPPEECRKHCKCLDAFDEGSEERRTWLPKCYLREIQGFADITVERIRKAVRKKIAITLIPDLDEDELKMLVNMEVDADFLGELKGFMD